MLLFYFVQISLALDDHHSMVKKLLVWCMKYDCANTKESTYVLIYRHILVLDSLTHDLATRSHEISLVTRYSIWYYILGQF